MAKKGFPCREAAWDAIRKPGRFGAEMVPYQHADAVTHRRRWVIRRKPSKPTHSDNLRVTPPALSDRQ